MTNRAILIALVILSTVGVVFGLVHTSQIKDLSADYKRIAEAYPEGFTVISIGMRGGRCQVLPKSVAKIWMAKKDTQTATWMIDGTCEGQHVVKILNFRREEPNGDNPAADGQTEHQKTAAPGEFLDMVLRNEESALGHYSYDIQIVPVSVTAIAAPAPPPQTASTTSAQPAGGPVDGSHLLRYCREWPCSN